MSGTTPSSEKAVVFQKFGARTRGGIFVGSHLNSGGRWSGDYLVVDAERYCNRRENLPVPVYRVKEMVATKE